MEDVELINKDPTLKETILGESVYFLKRKSPTKDKEKVTPSKVTTNRSSIYFYQTVQVQETTTKTLT